MTSRCRSPTAPFTDTQDIAVTVTNVNDNAPVITSNGGGATAAVNVAENTTAVTTVTATDADAGATLTYSISGGADAAKFTINATTGVLSFVSAPDFETPTDAGGNNVYDVQVQVSDGSLTDTQDIAVTVTDVVEAVNPFTSTGDTKLGSTSLNFVIDPRATYLRTNSDPLAVNFTAISLASLGIAAGDVLVIEQTGDYDPDGAEPDFNDSSTGMTAVFSTSATLTVSSDLDRVSGAVAAQDPVFGGQLPAEVTPNTNHRRPHHRYYPGFFHRQRRHR